MLLPRSLSSWRGRLRPSVALSWLFVIVTAITALHFLAIPNLRRLNLKVLGLSPFDYGFHGLYPTRKYVSFDFESPAVELAKWDSRCSKDFTFMAPHGDAVENPGAMILDARGELVWMMQPRSDKIQDFRVQEYNGEKFLTYWHGAAQGGHGRGAWSMLDSSYTRRFEVKAVGNVDGDMHDFQVTNNGTAMVIVYDVQPGNLSTYGGPEYGYFSDCLFQEIDIVTGDLLFQWRMSEHVSLDASYEYLKHRGWSVTEPYDPFHMNSIDKDSNGNYLISARHTHSIMSVDGQSGEILWTLGGRTSDFVDTEPGKVDSEFGWQHDARWINEHTITLFDNTAEWFLDGPTKSRGMMLDVDVVGRTFSVRSEFYHPEGIRAVSQGNMQVLSGSENVFIGWGASGAFTEFAPDGEMLCDSHFTPSNWFQLGKAVSYRVGKGSWVGKPTTSPKAMVAGSNVYVSWNGATEVDSWVFEVWDGESRENMNFIPLYEVDKDGFETEIKVPSTMPHVYFRLVALDEYDNVLGVTETLGRQLNWGLQDMIHRYRVSVSPGVVVSIVLIVCCCLLGAVAAWKRYKGGCKCRNSEYQPIPLDVCEAPDERQSFLRRSISSEGRPPTPEHEHA